MIPTVQTIPTPNEPLEAISINYMSSLPSIKRGNDYVFVVTDRFSRMVILIAYKKSITMESISKLFFDWMWVYLGILQTVRSD